MKFLSSVISHLLRNLPAVAACPDGPPNSMCPPSSSHNGAIRHSGDDRTGHGAGDDEVIYCQLSMLPPEATHVAFWVKIDFGGAAATFADVNNCFVRLLDGQNRVLCNFALREHHRERAMLMCVLSKMNNHWQVFPLGVPNHSIDRKTLIMATRPDLQETITVSMAAIKARDLMAADDAKKGKEATSDPYAKFTLWNNKEHKTDKIKKELNPVWNDKGVTLTCPK